MGDGLTLWEALAEALAWCWRNPGPLLLIAAVVAIVVSHLLGVTLP